MIYACCLGLYVEIITEAVLSYMPLLYLQRLRPFSFSIWPSTFYCWQHCVRQALRIHKLSLHACILYTYIWAYVQTVLYKYILYRCAFSIFRSCFKCSEFFGKSAHELTRTRRPSCSRNIASGAVLRSKLSTCYCLVYALLILLVKCISLHFKYKLKPQWHPQQNTLILLIA